jgi:hypothetical protein
MRWLIGSTPGGGAELDDAAARQARVEVSSAEDELAAAGLGPLPNQASLSRQVALGEGGAVIVCALTRAWFPHPSSRKESRGRAGVRRQPCQHRPRLYTFL